MQSVVKRGTVMAIGSIYGIVTDMACPLRKSSMKSSLLLSVIIVFSCVILYNASLVLHHVCVLIFIALVSDA